MGSNPASCPLGSGGGDNLYYRCCTSVSILVPVTDLALSYCLPPNPPVSGEEVSEGGGPWVLRPFLASLGRGRKEQPHWVGGGLGGFRSQLPGSELRGP